MQESFVRLHRILFERELLPLSSFGEERSRLRKDVNVFDKTALSRRAFVLFIRRESKRLTRGAVCLGWDSFKHLPPQCNPRRSWSLVFDTKGPIVDVGQRRLRADITTLGNGAPAGVPSFDLIVFNEVLEHVPNPFAATRSLYAMLKTGGLVFFTAPFTARHHLGWDFFRFTIDGAKRVFESAGFTTVVQNRVGNTYLASGFAMGFGSGDFESGWTRATEARIFHNANNSIDGGPQEWLYIGTAGVFQKPKSAAPVRGQPVANPKARQGNVVEANE